MDVFEGQDSAFVSEETDVDVDSVDNFVLLGNSELVCVDVALISVASFLRAVVSDRLIGGKVTVFDIDDVDVAVVAVCVELNFEFVLRVKAEVEDRV